RHRDLCPLRRHSACEAQSPAPEENASQGESTGPGQTASACAGRVAAFERAGLHRAAAKPEQLTDRRCVLDAARAPELIEPARDHYLRLHADIALVHVAIAADVAHDAHDPVAREPELLAIVAVAAQ